MNGLNVQLSSGSISWKTCADLPAKLSSAKTALINGKVYCGGGVADGDNRYIVYRYDLSQDNWTTLPPLPVRYFGLGQLNGKLVAVGGIKKSNNQRTDEVYTYDERSNEWKHTIPPMPTARDNPGVLSLESAILVAGGDTVSGVCASVEIFKLNTSRWYVTERLPTPCCELSLVTIGNTCYILGGFNYPTYVTQALHASIDDLLSYAIPDDDFHMPLQQGSVWKYLPNTPLYEPAAAELAGNLLAIGGKETDKGSTDMKEVFVFSTSSNSWVYVGDLPAPRSCIAIVQLSPVELLVIGGWCDGSTNTVFKGILHINL